MIASEKPKRAVVAEFHKAAGGRVRLFSMNVIEEAGHDAKGRALIKRTTYDVEWSRNYGYLFDQCGFGGDSTITVEGIYHVSGDARVKEKPTQLVDANDSPPWRGKKTLAIRARNKTRRLRQLPKALRPEPGQDLLDWLYRNAIEQDAVYCSECRDFMPSESLCEHCWWCNKRCWYSTPSNRCACKGREECNA